MAIESSGVRVAGSEHVEMWKDGLRGSEEGRELSLAARCGRNAFPSDAITKETPTAQLQ